MESKIRFCILLTYFYQIYKKKEKYILKFNRSVKNESFSIHTSMIFQK